MVGETERERERQKRERRERERGGEKAAITTLLTADSTVVTELAAMRNITDASNAGCLMAEYNFFRNGPRAILLG